MTASTPASMLPPLTPDQIDHSQALERRVVQRIVQAGGWLGFDELMDLALYSPGLGYYSAGSVKLGAAGDFVTAPEVSDLFSRCVARQCADVLAVLGGEIVEFGPGTGRMAATVLETLAALGRLPERYALLEVSADLRERQRATLARLPLALQRRVVWLERLPPAPIRGVVLANEVLDALPCERFVVRAGGVRSLGVGLDPEGALVEREAPATPQLEAAYARLLRDLPDPLPEGYRSEVCLRVEPWIASLADRLDQAVMLLFDYGLPRRHFYHPQRGDGTLRCHFRQRAHDNPYINLGVQDITAWVDFTRVAEAAHAAGLDVLGFATQAAFLLGLGLDALDDSRASTVERARWAGEARRLLLPGEMGEAFKVMALGRSFEGPLLGFIHQDLRDSL